MDDTLKSIVEALNGTAAKLLGSGHLIIDPRPTRAANPLSFYVPCQARLDALAPGDKVKVILSPDFNRNVPGPNEITERLWVGVTAAEGDDLTGTVVSTPMSPGILGIDRGGELKFKRHHVIGIETTREDDPAETNDNDGWFRRCRMDARIDEGAPIVRIVRDEPVGNAAEDIGVARFGWSGWRFEAEGYAPGMPLEMYALVVPTRRETGYEHLIDAPEGSVIERRGDEFVLVK